MSLEKAQALYEKHKDEDGEQEDIIFIGNDGKLYLFALISEAEVQAAIEELL